MVGAKIQGLALDVAYDIYVVGWKTTVTDPRSFYIGLTVNGQSGTPNTAMDPSGFTSLGVTNNLSTNVTNWVQGENYVKFTITPTAALPAIAILSGASSDNRAYINAIQIVAVPEPGVSALLVLSVAGLSLLIRRRRVQICD